jgi:hypothetical protein
LAQSEQIDQIAKALVAAQREMTLPRKNKTVRVRPRNGGAEYSFDYTTLDEIINHVREQLTKNGLWFTQTLKSENNAPVICTTLLHESGQWISSDLFVSDQGSNQEFGSSLSYRRRYALAALLGIVSDEDDDANGADGNEVKSKAEKPALRPKDMATAAAKKWGEASIKKLAAMKSGAEFDAWHVADVREKIAKLKEYDAALHASVMAAIAKTLDRLNPIGA